MNKNYIKLMVRDGKISVTREDKELTIKEVADIDTTKESNGALLTLSKFFKDAKENKQIIEDMKTRVIELESKNKILTEEYDNITCRKREDYEIQAKIIAEQEVEIKKLKKQQDENAAWIVRLNNKIKQLDRKCADNTFNSYFSGTKQTNISKEDLKKIYRQLVKVNHPDNNGNNEMMIVIARLKESWGI